MTDSWTDDEIEYLDFFPGGVPPGGYFELQVKDIEALLATPEAEHEGLDTVAELCLIGLVAYFEAFCRNQFAALLNICPELVRRLREKNRQTTLDAVDILALAHNVRGSLGSLVAERYDFGTPRSVNALFGDLLKITPFSKDEGKRFERLLEDRNLLVHHGGLFTPKYSGRAVRRRELKSRLFFDSIVITRDACRSTARFLSGIVEKTVDASRSALVQFVRDGKLRLSDTQEGAIEALKW